MLFLRCFLSMGSASGYRFDDPAVQCLAVMLFRGMCFFTPPRLLLKTIAQLFKKKKKVLSGEEEEMKVFLPNRSAAQQRSLSRLRTPSYSVVKNLLPLVLSWEQGTRLLGLLLHPSDEMHLVHLGCVLQGTEPKFWHCCNAHVSP